MGEIVTLSEFVLPRLERAAKHSVHHLEDFGFDGDHRLNDLARWDVRKDVVGEVALLARVSRAEKRLCAFTEVVVAS